MPGRDRGGIPRQYRRMNDETGDKARIGAQPSEHSDDLRAILDVTGFQRDLLLTVACAGNSYPCGQTVHTALETVWGKEVNESRVYQNLSELKGNDLITTHPIDGRTKGYRVTDRGQALICAYCSWARACLTESIDGDTDANGPCAGYETDS